MFHVPIVSLTATLLCPRIYCDESVLSGASSETYVPVWTWHILGRHPISLFYFILLAGVMNCVSNDDTCAYHFWFCLCVFPGVFISSRVTGACPVATDLTIRLNVRTTTTTTTKTSPTTPTGRDDILLCLLPSMLPNSALCFLQLLPRWRWGRGDGGGLRFQYQVRANSTSDSLHVTDCNDFFARSRSVFGVALGAACLTIHCKLISQIQNSAKA